MERQERSVRRRSTHRMQSRLNRKELREEGREKMTLGECWYPPRQARSLPKKLYPKESPPIYAGRYLPVGVGPLHGLASQPHSLPLYPVQWSPRGYMDPGAQLDISQSIWRVAPGPYPGPHPGPPREERSRSRDRGRNGGEDQRRRAQSKSPARRANKPSERYMDNVPNLAPDMSGLSRMFRDFGAGVKAKMSRPKTPLTPFSTDMAEQPSPTKSNLKKREEEKVTNANSRETAADNKKVHFNKFATVQMMA